MPAPPRLNCDFSDAACRVSTSELFLCQAFSRYGALFIERFKLRNAVSALRRHIERQGLFLCHVGSEAKCWADRESHAVAALFEQIVKEVDVNEIGGDAKANVFCGVEIKAAAHTVKGLEISLLTCGASCAVTKSKRRCIGLESGSFMHAADRRADEYGYPLELAEVELGAKGKGVGGGVKGHCRIRPEERKQGHNWA